MQYLADLFWARWIEEFLPALQLQVKPFPLYPALHMQVKFPTAFTQVAREWQLSVFDEHSSLSKAKFLNL